MASIQTYHSFDIVFSGESGTYRTEVISSPHGQAVGEFVLPHFADEVEAWQSGTAAADQLQAIGGQLFDRLFDGQVGECLRSSLARIDSKEGLRLNLRLHQTPELMLLPWELLYDTTHQRFLALSERTPINHYLALPLAQDELAIEPPLQILAVLSSPVDHQPQLDVEQEWQRLQAALVPLTRNGQVNLTRMDDATWTNLQGYLRQTTVHILHFVGHGMYDPATENGGLIFEDEDDFLQLVSARKLAHLLHNHPALRLAVLNACEGAATSAQTPFSGVAQSLVQQGLPAVIAMQRDISDVAAITLAQTFYAAIADGYPVDTSLTQARLAIYATDDAEWAVPALFMRSPDGALFDFAKTVDIPTTVNRASPPTPTQPPLLQKIAGREQELAYYLAQLEADHLAVISGMPGVGKTTLAALIATKLATQQPIFWHSFRENEQIDVLIWQLAGFLAWHGLPAIWHDLNNRQGYSHNTPPETIFNSLIQLLSEQAFLICLDNFQHVDNDPLVETFVARLRDVRQQDRNKVLITTQRRPDFVPSAGHRVLEGLHLEEMATLLTNDAISLSDRQLRDLHNQTGGNAQFLTLAINLLKHGVEPHFLVEQLTTTEDIERYLLDEIDAGLSEEERDVLSVVALFQGEPCTREAIEIVLASDRSLLRTLSDLSARYLLSISHSHSGRTYAAHTTVGNFYYGLLASHRRQEMHRRVGAYFEFTVVDLLAATRHHRAAGEVEHATTLLAENVGVLLNQGQALTLQVELEQLTEGKLGNQLLAQLQEARGDTLYLLGNLDESINAFQQALYLAEMGDRLLRIRLARKRGEVLARKGDHELAKQSFQQAKDLLAESAEDLPDEYAHLSVGIGTLRLTIGEYDEILSEIQQTLEISDYAISPLVRADLHDLLGRVFYFKRNWTKSMVHFETALASREAAQNLRGVLRSHSNIAVVYREQKRLDDAARANQSALEIAEQIGDTVALTLLYTNLALVYSDQEKYAAAIEFLTKCLQLAEKMGNVQGLRLSHLNLGYVHRLMKQFDVAIVHSRKAVSLAEQVDDLHVMISSRLTLASIYFDQKLADKAIEEAQRALKLAEETGYRHWLPRLLTLLGKAYALQDERRLCDEYFDRAIDACRELEAERELVETLLARAQIEQTWHRYLVAQEHCRQAIDVATRNQLEELHLQVQSLYNQLISENSQQTMGDDDG